MKKVFLVFALIFACVAGVNGQARFKNKADALYKKLSYQLAIPYYEHHLKKNIDNDATMKLADCYRLTHDYQNAAKWYDRVLAIPGHPPITYFYYGHALLQNGDIDGARQMFQDYAAAMPEDKRGKNFLKAIERRPELHKDSTRIDVEHLPFNSEHAEFGTFPYQDGIVFASSREVGIPVRQSFNWLDTPFLDFFYTSYKKDSAKWAKPDWIKGEVNTRYHESNFTQQNGESEFFFTRNNYNEKEKGKSDEGIIKLKLYSGRINGLETTEITELDLNSDEYSNTHPSISADGLRLYFVSDRPGGVGGKDIYVANRVGEGWSEPVNLENINTPGDEMFPFIHPDGTLYFSSDGHPGLGHLDIFYVHLSGNQQVVNMGYPINGAWDDFAFYLDKDNENGFLSSDRPEGDGGDDIYKVTLRRPVLQILVLDSIAELPIRNAKVSVKDLTDNSKYDLTTDSTGMVGFKTYFDHKFEILVETSEFDPHLTTFSTVPSGDEMSFLKIVQLWSPPPAISAIVIDEKTQQRLPGATIEFVSLRVGEKEERIADMNGRFHIRLKPFTYYEMNVKHPGYLTYSQRVSTTQTAFDGDTIIPLKMEKIIFNKPIRLENIKYDFDKWTIRADAYNDLIYLAELMKKNPTIIVELGSHTDARGSDKYNEELSQKRANAARYFMIDLGIDPARIKAKGYGEYQLSNCCYDGEPCTEQEHQRNRRTEFKIIGTIDGVDMENSQLETNEAGDGFRPEDCPKYKGKPGVKPTPVKVQPTTPVITPPKPKRDTLAAAMPVPQPIVDAKPKVIVPTTDADVVAVKSGNPVYVKVENDAPAAKKPVEPYQPVIVVERDSLQKGNRSQPTAVAAESPKDSNSVGSWMGDSAPIGNNDEFILPAFKHNTPPSNLGDAVTFRVQLGAYKEELSIENRRKLGGLEPYIFYQPVPTGFPRCFVGDYLSAADVKKAFEQIRKAGFNGAYITGYRNGTELNVGEIRILLHEERRI
ncbi:MAG: PD40 domain-containing protein [Bacteroidetes bacterium]|nr:PD40 domain-containing protein [Bacteroidota bacterium]